MNSVCSARELGICKSPEPPWTAAWSSAKRDAAVRTAASPFDTASGRRRRAWRKGCS